MLKNLPKWWRWVCLAHTLIALGFGLVFLFIPGFGMTLISWAIVDPFVDRLLGAALLAMAWAHFLSSRESTTDKLSIPIQLYWIFDLLGTILSLWAGITYLLWSAWLLVVIYGFFFCAYSYVLFHK